MVRSIVQRSSIERSKFEKAAAFLRMAFAGMINDETAHHPCGVCHESGLVRKRRMPFSHVEISFVQKGGHA